MKKLISLGFLFALLFQESETHATNLIRNKNYICNGNFEEPQLPAGKNFMWYPNIPCWGGPYKIQLNKGHNQFPGSQYLDMDPDQSGHGYQQKVTLDRDGYYMLEFEYSTRPGQSMKENSFSVYFNGEEVVRVRPAEHRRRQVRKEVYGKKGQNFVEFLDEGSKVHHGCGIDNVGLFELKVLIQE